MSIVKLFDPTAQDDEPRTVQDVIDLYLAYARRRVAARTYENCESVLTRFCAEHGDALLAECKPYHLSNWIDSHAEFKSDWTICRVVRTIQRPFNWAAKGGMIPRNPFAGVGHHQGKRGRAATEDEWRAMIRCSTDSIFRRLLIFLRYSGARPGEASAAEWSFIDLEAGTLTLQEHKTVGKTREPRIVYLHPVLCKLLIWIQRHNPHPRFILTNAWFVDWKRSALSQRLKTIRRRAGLPKDLRLYGLRHKFGSDAILGGVDIKTLAELMGHRHVRTTEIYIHIAGNIPHMQKAVKKIFTHG